MKYLLLTVVVLMFALMHGLSQLALASEVNGESIAIALKVSVIAFISLALLLVIAAAAFRCLFHLKRGLFCDAENSEKSKKVVNA